MNLNQVEYMIAIANTGSLSAAAKEVGISQPAMSKYLFGLEEYFGLEMFYRENRKLILTEAGRMYLDGITRIYTIMQETRSMIRALDVKEKTVLTIGLSPHQGAMAMAQFYPKMRAAFPGLQLRIYESYTMGLYEAVRKGKADYALTTVLEGQDGVGIFPLAEEELVLAVPEYHNLAALASMDPERLSVIDVGDFCDMPFVLMDEAVTTIGAVSRRILRDEGLDPMIAMKSDNGYLVKEMIRAGAGVGFLPYHYMDFQNGLVYFRLKRPYRFTYCIIIKKNEPMTKEERFLTFMQILDMERCEYRKLLETEEIRSIRTEFEKGGPDGQ